MRARPQDSTGANKAQLVQLIDCLGSWGLQYVGKVSFTCGETSCEGSLASGSGTRESGRRRLRLRRGALEQAEIAFLVCVT